MKETLFMGKVTSSMTHEIKNVLAIIRESAGLAQDLLVSAQDTAFPHKERFSKIMDKIDKQVERGAEIVSTLNSFAHLPDHEVRNEDLNSVIDQMLLLSGKLSRTNGVKFLIEENTKSVFMEADPLKSRMTLYRILEFLAPLMGKGSEIRLKSMKNGKGTPMFGLFIKTVEPVQLFLERIQSLPEWGAIVEEFRGCNTLIETKSELDAVLINFEK
ncbi:MAG: hypothetical protein V1897_18530 [Pseudomonadota bacterium]